MGLTFLPQDQEQPDNATPVATPPANGGGGEGNGGGGSSSARCGRYLTRLYYDPDGKVRKK